MPFVHANSINIYYEIHRQGEPLVLISGLGGDRNFWQPSLETLSAHFQVILFDTRGIGKTDAPHAPYSMDLFADDLAGLLDTLHLVKVQLLGYSMGGNIALQFSLKYPDRISKLILAASCAVLNNQIRLYVDAVLAAYENGLSTKQMFDLVAPWLFSAQFLNQPENAAYLQYDENDPEQQPLYAWRNQYLAQREFNVTEELPDIQQPVLVLAGEHDLFANSHDAKILASGLPQAQLIVIPGVGHLFNYEQPELFHRAVIDFLKG